MGEHCEYRVDIHEDPFKSSHQADHSRVALLIVLGVILISFVMVLSLVIMFQFCTFWQTGESTAKTMDDSKHSSRGNMQLCNKIRSIGEKEESGECQGISAVELL